MTQGFKLAEATLAVPFDDPRLVFAARYGIALFREVPTMVSIGGGVLEHYPAKWFYSTG